MLKQQIVVLGLGRFGSALAEALYEQGHDVLAVDRDIRRVEEILPRVTHAAQADATDPDALAELSVNEFDSAVVAMTETMEASILATISLKDLGLRHIVAKARSDQHARILTRIGADQVVFPERDMGIRWARRFAMPNMRDYLEIIPGFGISTLIPDGSLVGRKISEIGFGERLGLTLIGLARGEVVRLYPSMEEEIHLGDILIVAGADKRLGGIRG